MIPFLCFGLFPFRGGLRQSSPYVQLSHSLHALLSHQLTSCSSFTAKSSLLFLQASCHFQPWHSSTQIFTVPPLDTSKLSPSGLSGFLKYLTRAVSLMDSFLHRSPTFRSLLPATVSPRCIGSTLEYSHRVQFICFAALTDTTRLQVW